MCIVCNGKCASWHNDTAATCLIKVLLLGCSSEQDEIWNITWPATLANEITAPRKCPGGNETEGEYTASYLYMFYMCSNKQAHNITGNATRACVGNNNWAPPNVTQCRNTELMTLQDQARAILNDVENTNKTTLKSFNPLKMLISATAKIRDIINTTIPILPRDIPIILNTLRTILKYVRSYVCEYFIRIARPVPIMLKFYLRIIPS